MKQILKELGFEELPTLSEFVIAVGITHVDSPINEQNIYDYTDFIRQPLTKGMFVPCDEEGELLQKPAVMEDDADIWQEYQQAKERVLFKGYEYRGSNTTKGIHKIKCHTFKCITNGMILRLDDDGVISYGKPARCLKTDITTIEQAINNGIKLILK